MSNLIDKEIIHHLAQGGLIAYPTETVWGIGCDAFCQSAVMDLLTLKNRPISKGLIVLTDSTERILPFLNHLPAHRQHEILASWQNPNANHEGTQATTWLFPIPPSLPTPIPAWITGEHDSLAIRVIKHPTIAQICQDLVSDTNPYGFLVSTSCNLSTLPPAKDLTTAKTYFGDDDAVLFVHGETLGYHAPSQIRCAMSGNIIRI